MSQLNDPRVFFAAERTLLAWNRTSLTLMAFGFVIERSGLLLRALTPQPGMPGIGGLSFWIGIGFIVLGAVTAVAAIVQYRAVLRTLKPVEIPEGYRATIGIYVNALVALLGAALTGYLLYGIDAR
ncbi:YidH family protein [Nitrospira sp. Nam80]